MLFNYDFTFDKLLIIDRDKLMLGYFPLPDFLYLMEIIKITEFTL